MYIYKYIDRHLWFSAGHLDFQSLKCESYSTDRTLRLGQSLANHD